MPSKFSMKVTPNLMRQTNFTGSARENLKNHFSWMPGRAFCIFSEWDFDKFFHKLEQ
ncbi:hypothetical protein ACP70R_027407 [Stipagrostis hirtigluma subsp. patula]